MKLIAEIKLKLSRLKAKKCGIKRQGDESEGKAQMNAPATL